MGHPRILLWYRRDLRLHDHAPLYHAQQQQAQIIPLYCFDPREFGTTAFGFPKTGALRGQFLREAVQDLRQSWRQNKGDLLLRIGQPEKLIPELCRAWQIQAVYWHRAIASEERTIEKRLEKALQRLGIQCVSFWDQTLHQPEDLPFSIPELPEVFTQFRQAVEKFSEISPPLPTPQTFLPLPENLEQGELPTLETLGLTPIIPDPRGVLPFVGGETTGLKRLQAYFWQGDRLQTYKQTRNGMVGADYSTKFSPWLALGCLSPRYIAAQVRDYETTRIANDSTYWLIFELLWRDYFRWIAVKHGNKIFHPAGLQGVAIPWRVDQVDFELWRTGQTGIPFVDANMRELLLTGFMSNRGRQNVGSFLTKNLGLDWRLGAEWFESQLIDYDVCSNWGNWNYTAGVGNDARGFRYFNIPKQAKDYDHKGDYVRLWLPELAALPGELIHQPWLIAPQELGDRHGIILGETYPKPMVDLQESVRINEQIYRQAMGLAPEATLQKHHQRPNHRRSKPNLPRDKRS
jgi:deoxyribodipyrimidine photo-lyase